jgi:hypothetical protein
MAWEIRTHHLRICDHRVSSAYDFVHRSLGDLGHSLNHLYPKRMGVNGKNLVVFLVRAIKRSIKYKISII